MAATKKKQVLDIFSVLKSLGNKDLSFYDNLNEEQIKAVHPLVIQRWMSGTPDPSQIVLINEFVNPYVFPLHDHKRLLVSLLAIASSGNGSRVSWVKAKGKNSVSTPHMVGVIKSMYGYTTKDAMEVLPILSNDDILEIASDLGYQPDQLKPLKLELKKR